MAVTSAHSFEATRLSYKDLLSSNAVDNAIANAKSNSKNALLTPLHEDGIVSIGNIPGFAQLKKDTLSKLHSCIMSDQEHEHSTLEHTYNDGTIRRTKATFTVPGPGGMQSLFPGRDEASLSPICQSFQRNLHQFRSKVDEVTTLFAQRLSREMMMGHVNANVDEDETVLQVPLMRTPDGSYTFDTVEDVVKEGLHLEHFHSYQKMEGRGQEDKKDALLRSGTSDSATIDLHTDQGFFIAFTPGMNLDASASRSDPLELNLAQDFLIQMSDGSMSTVQFDQEDDLVFMIGDGAKQYINPKIQDETLHLRATPHAVKIQSHDNESDMDKDMDMVRVWYGRMVLPPQGAYSERDEMTYGQVRSLLTQAGDSDGSSSIQPGLGCSSSKDVARQLEGGHGHSDPGVDCGLDATYCWNRCMPHEDHKDWDWERVSDDICESRNLQLQCINIRDEVWDGTSHGDYFPACSNTTDPISAVDNLDNYPRDECTCQVDWETFSSSDNYEHEFDLSIKGTSAKFMWSVVDDETIKGKVAFNGLFGWIGFGFASPDGGHNGMNGGNVILGLPGGNFSAITGLDMNVNGSVHSYQIDEVGSSFRHWSTPVTTATSRSSTNAVITLNDDCHTAMSFETSMINDKSFAVNGTNEMIWAANGQDSHVSYHGANRGKFQVTWKTGNATMISSPTWGPPLSDPECDGNTTEGSDRNEDESRAAMHISFMVAFLTSFLGFVLTL